jgi:hypothetical protein
MCIRDSAGAHQAETARVEQLATDHAGQPGLTFSLAISPAEGAQARFGGIAAIHGAKYVITL